MAKFRIVFRGNLGEAETTVEAADYRREGEWLEFFDIGRGHDPGTRKLRVSVAKVDHVERVEGQPGR